MGYKLFPVHSPAAGTTGCDCKAATCSSPAKHPRTMHGKDDASDHLDQLTVWFGNQWPHANIGLVTGAVSGIVVVDVDPRNGGDVELQRLWAEHGAFPAGPVAATGGGGWHYFFKHPGTPIRSRNGAVGEGLDVKADGGYVIAAPSVHRTGLSYEWCEGMAPWEVATPPLPTWLLLLMTQDTASPFEGAGEIPSVIRQGARREHLLSLAGSMRHRGMGERSICAALLAENDEKCTPPLELTEVTKLAAVAAAWPPGEATLRSSAIKNPEVGVRTAPQTFTAVELYGRELSEVKWAVQGLLPEGLAIFAGKPKMGKSWMSFQMGIAIAEGGVALGSVPVEDGEVLILAMEDNMRRLKKRLMTLIGDDAPPPRLHFEIKWPREDEGGLDALDAWLGQHPRTRLVVIDTLAKFRKRGSDPKYQDDYASIEGLQQMAGRHGICIMLIHHLRKALSDDWVDTISGTLGIAGAADTLLAVEGKRGQRDAVLHLTGRDIEDDRDLAMERDDSTGVWTIVGDAAAYKLGKETAFLVQILTDLDHPSLPAEVALHLGKTRAATKQLLWRAAKAGHIRHFGNGQYGLIFTGNEGSGVVLAAVEKSRNGDS